MTRDDLLAKLFPKRHAVTPGPAGSIAGTALVEGVGEVTVVGMVDRTPISIDAALHLAGRVLDTVRDGGQRPIVMIVDSGSQNMTRRDELLGLNEFLAHLAKSLALAALHGHATVSVLYGPAAAGAFIASSLSSRILVAVDGSEPSVMDLPSISRVTKLPITQLRELAKSTPIFAPGTDPLYAIGAVTEKWPADGSLAARLAKLLAQPFDGEADRRDTIGLERKGRLLSHDVAVRVMKEAANG